MLKVGDKASFEKTISESDVYLFAGITGDLNPLHINQEKAKNSIFGERIVHGMLVGGLVSTVIGCYLPGAGTIDLSQNFEFVAPVKISDTIKAEVEIVEIVSRKKGIYKLETCAFNQNGKKVLNGYAVVKWDSNLR